MRISDWSSDVLFRSGSWDGGLASGPRPSPGSARLFQGFRPGTGSRSRPFAYAAIASGWISPARYWARALDRLSLPELVRGRVRGGISSTRQFIDRKSVV